MDGRVEPSEPFDRFALARQRMVHQQLRSRGISDDATLIAMGLVPREAFVPASQAVDAYADRAMAIGNGQTISQPYIVARMTELLGLGEPGRHRHEQPPHVLDIGTGSGYQAAVLAQLGASVISVERDAGLAEAAGARLGRLGYVVEVIIADGSLGHAAAAPYAGIVVAAAAPRVPGPLIDQLSDGARLVIPVGTRSSQRLTVVRRIGAGTETISADACVFVPLVGSHGFPA